ncbi:hypothetical protein CYMTET_27711 [Cymbomonas tetramitiformis]|uniref:Uncharacterized protein n=1 Tax=Cymbomonas tetramitiformis TaxID=36881 RepID=A0AAE0FPE2_9CHLO|nr:hypothetical protein CYMTET_27711 [Cymbomonas tetramitiformis]
MFEEDAEEHVEESRPGSFKSDRSVPASGYPTQSDWEANFGTGKTQKIIQLLERNLRKKEQPDVSDSDADREDDAQRQFEGPSKVMPRSPTKKPPELALLLGPSILRSKGFQIADAVELLPTKRERYHVLISVLFLWAFHLFVMYLLLFPGSENIKISQSVEMPVVPERPFFLANSGIYRYLDTMLGKIYDDTDCGDELCEWPMETKAFGRFGCKIDCGSYSEEELTTVVLKIKSPAYSPNPDVSVLSLVSRVARDTQRLHVESVWVCAE